jgi:hypothetical protein
MTKRQGLLLSNSIIAKKEKEKINEEKTILKTRLAASYFYIRYDICASKI